MIPAPLDDGFSKRSFLWRSFYGRHYGNLITLFFLIYMIPPNEQPDFGRHFDAWVGDFIFDSVQFKGIIAFSLNRFKHKDAISILYRANSAICYQNEIRCPVKLR